MKNDCRWLKSPKNNIRIICRERESAQRFKETPIFDIPCRQYRFSSQLPVLIRISQVMCSSSFPAKLHLIENVLIGTAKKLREPLYAFYFHLYITFFSITQNITCNHSSTNRDSFHPHLLFILIYSMNLIATLYVIAQKIFSSKIVDRRFEDASASSRDLWHPVSCQAKLSYEA